MSERAKHLFQFHADKIAGCAKVEASYHQERQAFWETELEEATKRVEATAGVRVQRVAITGGWRPEVVVNYGDPAAYDRMGEAGRKIQEHRQAMERFLSDAALYATQDRVYELDADDVSNFRLNGKVRED
jgi:hypothetical protein